MIRWIYNLFFGSTPADFESDYTLAESVELLSQVVHPAETLPTRFQSANGRVSASKVVVYRQFAMITNSFKPLFKGEFTEEGGRVRLRGRFTMHTYSKVMLGYVLGFNSLLLGCAFFSIPESDWYLNFLPGVGMLAILCGFVWFCKWLARDDTQWLSDLIRAALTSESP